jgi:hypothetical protein
MNVYMLQSQAFQHEGQGHARRGQGMRGLGLGCVVCWGGGLGGCEYLWECVVGWTARGGGL